jgi:divalent metal cation (Fe/Co/Zn/Cd) transporter
LVLLVVLVLAVLGAGQTAYIQVTRGRLGIPTTPEDRCSPVSSSFVHYTDREALIRRAFRLEWFTMVWMAVEIAVAVTSGVAAHSVSLIAFGVDSLIELSSAAVLMWRLSVELKHGRAFSQRAERIAARVGGALLFALAAYVVVAAGWGLWNREGQAFSWAGLAVTILSIPIMYLLARRKLAIAGQLGSRALRADAVEAITCGWLSSVVIVGLVAQLVLDTWWIDSVAALAITWLLVREGREAWAEEQCCLRCDD